MNGGWPNIIDIWMNWNEKIIFIETRIHIKIEIIIIYLGGAAICTPIASSSILIICDFLAPGLARIINFIVVDDWTIGTIDLGIIIEDIIIMMSL